MKDVSVWVFSSERDPLVNYYTNTIPQWNKICRYISNPGNCRLSTFTEVLNPDGSKGDSNHRLYTTIMYDLFTVDGSVYPNVTTVDGNGDTVSIEGDNGIISWMCNTHSSFEGVKSENSPMICFVEQAFIPLRNIVFRIANLIQKKLGFVQ